MFNPINLFRKCNAEFGRSVRINNSLSRRSKRHTALPKTTTFAEVCENRVLLSAVALNGTTGDDAFELTFNTDATVVATISTDGGPTTPLGTYSTSDVFTVQGNAGSDAVRVVGSADADVFSVTSNGATVNGIGGIDLISIESATLAGAAGDDQYLLNTDAAIGPLTLEENGVGRDKIDFSSTTLVDVDVDLSLVTVQVVNANLSLQLSSATAFEDLIGGSGNDILTGNASANVIMGNDGDDTVIGRGGNDTFVFETATSPESDTVVELAGEGTDTLAFYALTTDVNVSLATTVAQSVHTNRTLTLNSATTSENVFGGSGNDTLTGNTLANALIGGRGSDSLIGGAGDDLYRFAAATSAEADVVIEAASEGIDTLHFGDMSTAVNVDMGSTLPQAVNLNRALTLSSSTSVENVLGGSGSDTLTGNAVANMISGGAGNDIISGGLGNDTLVGGRNNDSYVFEAATSAESDSIVELAGEGTDTLDFFALTTDVNVSLATIAAQSVHTNRSLTLNSTSTVENVYGGSGNDTLTGNTLANALIGGRGSDSLIGGAGDDLYRFGAATSAEADVVIEAASEGIDTLHFGDMSTAVNVDLGSTLPQAVNLNRSLTLSSSTNLENVIGGTGSDSLTGNALANVITGGVGNDIIAGGLGNDTLVGGLNNDSYVFETVASAETDSIVELAGEGTDTLDFFALTTDVNVSLASTTAQAVHANRTLLLNSATSIENVFGGSGNDTLTGNTLANALIGGRGSDSLTGGAGDDLYRFSAAASTEADVVFEAAAEGIDTLYFAELTTAVNLDLGSTLSQVVNLNRSLTLNSSTSVENAIGGAGTDTLTGNASSNVLVGTGGNDQLTGLESRDILIGGLGIDSLSGGADEDILIAGFTTSDVSVSKLNSLHTEWNAATLYDVRVAALRAGTGSPVVSLQAMINVLDDGGAVDTLTGGAETDWYFRAIDDVIVDLVVGEEVDSL